MALAPPDGYEFDAAIATTYSLDLNALLAVPISLCFSDTLDGDLKGEKLALLEAIGQLKGRLKVFYQAGNIKVPDNFNRLFTLLEPSLYAINPPSGANSSFHPKIWLIRYLPDQNNGRSAAKKACYRLLVSSRNLTFDRSWDVAVRLDGQIGNKQFAVNEELSNFVENLLKKVKGFYRKQQFLDEVSRIQWDAPSKFEDVSLHVGGRAEGSPIKLEKGDSSKLLVVSPFLKDSAGEVKGLDFLQDYGSPESRYLFSRASELDAIGSEKLRNWQCFSLNELIVQGEERNEITDGAPDIQQLDLHAKLFIQQIAAQSHWFLGSANATSAAIGDKTNGQVRNAEFMVRLSSTSSEVSLDAISDLWTSEESGPLFVPHEFAELRDEEFEGESDHRLWLYKLIALNWKIKAEGCGLENKFDLTVSVNEKPDFPENISVNVGQLGISQSHQLELSMKWGEVPLDSISALIPVTLSVTEGDKQARKTIVVEAMLEFDGEDTRHSYIMRSLFDSHVKVLSYLNILLQRKPDKNNWLPLDEAFSGGGEGFFFDGMPLFERLLMASSREPLLLDRVEAAIKRFESAKVDMPVEFLELWKHFRSRR
ncbi:MAG: phospholipase D family protein [Alcanivoracaceae bacterium]|nr:phospholipase D family protein [Alcanivoracaceae bacterium]